MRITKGKSATRDATFKVDKKSKEEQEFFCLDLDEEEWKFTRRMKKGIDKYKGKIPFKCFNCGREGHYFSKCSYNKEENKFKGKEKNTYNRMKNEKSLKIKVFIHKMITIPLMIQMNPLMKKESINFCLCIRV